MGFASLALTPIPPVKIFGLHVAFGIMAAWALTVSFIPAYIMFMDERKLKAAYGQKKNNAPSLMAKWLESCGRFAITKIKTVLIITGLFMGLSAYGISLIKVNDNPVQWFKENQKIRIADQVMNEHFGGTYMSYVVLSGQQEADMKRPEVVKWIADLQAELESLAVVGKTTSIADIVKRINYVLHDEKPEYNIVPDNSEELAQYLFLFLMSGNPRDLDKMVDYAYKETNIWVQMKRGDNLEMEHVVRATDAYVKLHPLPTGISYRWAGLTYINVIWQNKMVKGMISALLGSFVIVFLLMTFLFRSLKYGLLSMIPLSVTIIFIYGVTGLIGKDYDMPVAVLSSLTLGLSVDFAIHFLQRYREINSQLKDRRQSLAKMFQEPARAITRNVLVVAFGFTPLLFAPLVPYVTVGIFMVFIMLVSGLSTLILLPTLVTVFSKKD